VSVRRDGPAVAGVDIGVVAAPGSGSAVVPVAPGGGDEGDGDGDGDGVRLPAWCEERQPPSTARPTRRSTPPARVPRTGPVWPARAHGRGTPVPPAYPGMPLHSPPVTALSALGVLALVLVAALALVLVGSFNGLVRLRTRVDAAWAQIDVQLQRRHDLIPNLVEAVKGYAAHERGVLEEVTAARSTAVGAHGVDARGQAEQQVSGALRPLLAVA